MSSLLQPAAVKPRSAAVAAVAGGRCGAAGATRHGGLDREAVRAAETKRDLASAAAKTRGTRAAALATLSASAANRIGGNRLTLSHRALYLLVGVGAGR